MRRNSTLAKIPALDFVELRLGEDAIPKPSRASLLKRHWREWSDSLDHCPDPACSRTHRLWQGLWRRRNRIRLEGKSYCSATCLEKAARSHFERAQEILPASPKTPHRISLGLLLVSRGQVSNSDLQIALSAQRAGGEGRIGEWLERLGFVSEQQVTAALGLQWACPTLPYYVSDEACSQLLPFSLMERFRMLPVRYVALSRVFYIAFSERVDYTALRTIEQMLDCRTEPCLVNRTTMAKELGRMGAEKRPSDILFDGVGNAAEMARIACGYVLKLGITDVRIAGCGEPTWVRLIGRRDSANLIFRPSPSFTSL